MIICGIDECGRGALAGPLVAAGVILDKKDGSFIDKLKDSKQLSGNERLAIYEDLIKTESIVSIAMISVRQINNQGVGWANIEAIKRLIRTIEADIYIVDGNLKIKVKGKKNLISSLVKADTKIHEVMAASIVAKVTRDKLMQELHISFPYYGWYSNVGYGTRYHISAIYKNGETRHHRNVFVRTALSNKGWGLGREGLSSLGNVF